MRAPLGCLLTVGFKVFCPQGHLQQTLNDQRNDQRQGTLRRASFKATAASVGEALGAGIMLRSSNGAASSKIGFFAALIGSILAFAGCANTVDSTPSYLGFAPTTADAASLPAEPPADGVRHVSSNKVLGAMAFQKVTGRPVDPRRLIPASN